MSLRLSLLMVIHFVADFSAATPFPRARNAGNVRVGDGSMTSCYY